MSALSIQGVTIAVTAVLYCKGQCRNDISKPVCSEHTMPCIKLINKITHSPLFKRTIYDKEKIEVQKFLNELSFSNSRGTEHTTAENV